MAKYIDLSSVVDVEPEVCEVLPLIEDDDLQYEFWQRLDEGFFKDFLCNHCNENDLSIMKEILEGIMKASVGDYIIKGVNGEFYPCKPDIFEKTYERVIDEAD